MGLAAMPTKPNEIMRNRLGRKMKKIITVFLCLCTLSANAETLDRLKCDFSGIDSPMITVKIENDDLTGAELEVPRDYFMLRSADGEVREAMGMRVWKDSFLPYTKQDALSDDQSKKRSEGRAEDVLILISSLKDLDTIAQLGMRFDYPEAGNINEKRSQPVSGPLITLKNGMSGYRTGDDLLQQEKLAMPRFHELLLGENNGEIADVFHCDQIGDVPSPGCQQIFEYGAYDVKISYRRNDLPRWRELRRKTEQLLACLTIKKPTNK